MCPTRAQAGFLPSLLVRQFPDLFSKNSSREETDKAILELNVIVVYKRLVQGLVYSPPDCDTFLALDAEPQGSKVPSPTRRDPCLWYTTSNTSLYTRSLGQ